VKVFLPQVIDRVEKAAIDESISSKPPGGIETVLLVEDNAMVRDLAASALREGGYHLLLADNGLQALQVANQNTQPIDLLITDVVMSELGGVGLAQKLQYDHPHLRVIYMSGYTDETITDHGVETGAATFLAKPFMTSELLIKVREVLDAG